MLNRHPSFARTVRTVRPSLHWASLASLALSLPPLGAQAQAEDTPPVEQVDITGSRVRAIAAPPASPVVSLTQEEMRSTQPASAEEVLRQLPAAVPSVGPGVNNGSGGGATIDLRGLGAQRTLVLVDGRRLVPFDLNAQVDTNVLPLALIRRIDVVTGGASAVYGADAITGVVNAVLKRDFTGIDLSGQYGLSDRGDAARRRFDLTAGTGWGAGRGHVVASVGKTRNDLLYQAERPWGEEARSSSTGLPTGSTTTVPVAVQVAAAPGVTPNPLSGTRQIDIASGRFVPIYSPFNTNPDNLYQTPLDRTQGTLLADFSVHGALHLYADFLYTKDEVGTRLASTGTFLNPYQLPIGNPFLPDAARAQLCAARGIAAANCVAGSTLTVPVSIGRRFVEMGPRVTVFDNEIRQLTTGARGELGAGWSYDAWFSHGRSDQARVRSNWGSNARVQQALRATSATACLDPSNGCVPIDVFGADGSLTPEMIAFINQDTTVRSLVRQNVAAATVSGALPRGWRSPLADEPVGVALGVESRRVRAGTQSDAAVQIQGEVLGLGTPVPDREGRLRLDEVFAEAVVPLLRQRPGAHLLDLEAGLRHTRLETATRRSYDTWKLGANWEPARGFKLRAMGQRAIRAPNINELYAPQVTGRSNLAVDPCGGNAVNAAEANTPGTLSNLCRLTGVPVQQLGSLPQPSSGQIAVLTGGNANLGPERADTLTLGFVLQPAGWRGVTLTLDYYRIDLKNAITAPSSTDVLDQCYSTAFNPGRDFNAACAKVGRGSLGTFNGLDATGVQLVRDNLGHHRTDGVDLGVAWATALPAGWGRLDLKFNGTWVRRLQLQATPASLQRDCNGYYSIACESLNTTSPVHKLKTVQRGAWTLGDWGLGWQWRHLGKLRAEPASTPATGWLPEYASIGARDYLDLFGHWDVNTHLRLRFSIANLFDRPPPRVGSTVGSTTYNNGDTYPQTYDAIGRYITLGANLVF